MTHYEETDVLDAGAVSLGLLMEVQQFLYREARLLDEERYDDWLATLTDDIRYWMPGVQARFRRDDAHISRTRMAYFDDDMEYLKIRVARAKQPTAWAEDPPTRHFHLVSNIEVEETDNPAEWLVHSLVLNYRVRGECDQMEMSARRRDIIRRVADGSLKLARREIYLQQAVLMSKNINTFL